MSGKDTRLSCPVTFAEGSIDTSGPYWYVVNVNNGELYQLNNSGSLQFNSFTNVSESCIATDIATNESESEAAAFSYDDSTGGFLLTIEKTRD
jgi:hypothetical protein